jgi:hypothetical protein
MAVKPNFQRYRINAMITANLESHPRYQMIPRIGNAFAVLLEREQKQMVRTYGMTQP